MYRNILTFKFSSCDRILSSSEPNTTQADADKKKKTKKKEDEAPAEKKKAQRSGSNVFAMFTQSQVQTFKEVSFASFPCSPTPQCTLLTPFLSRFGTQAFQMIDQDKDGFISKNDIRQTFDSLGMYITTSV